MTTGPLPLKGPPPPGGSPLPQGVLGGSGLSFPLGDLWFWADSGPDPGGNLRFDFYFGPKHS